MQCNSHGLLKDSAPTVMVFQRLLDPILGVGMLLVLNHYSNLPHKGNYVLLAAIVFLLILPVFKAVGLYRSYRGEALAAEAPRILLGWGIVLTFLLFLGYSTNTSAIFPRIILLSWSLSVPLVLYMAHLGIRIVLRWVRASGHNTRTAVIAGATKVGYHLAEQIHQTPYLGIRLQGFFDDKPASDLQDFREEKLIGTLKELPKYVRCHQIDVVYIALPSVDEMTFATLIGELQDTTASLYFAPNVSMCNLIQSKTYQLNGIPLISVWEVPFSGSEYVLKQAIDTVLAGLALIFLSPLMAVIALGVKLSSPGPIIFNQHRYGLGGQEIVVYKFRSMTVMEDGNSISQAKRSDPRVTKFGAFLRRTSLDELPQFINVLQGRMSIVGPRPHAVAHNEQYRKLINGYMLRHKVKPGITGWAQIHGLRGETDTLDKMKKRVEYDLDYLSNWSIGLDLQIICRTTLALFRNQNAY